MRVCRVYRDLSFISASWHWPELSALVEVERRSFNQKTQEESIEKRYFITNLPRGEVARIAYAIRSQWVVENGLHWTLDVVFDEDRSRKRKPAAWNTAELERILFGLPGENN